MVGLEFRRFRSLNEPMSVLPTNSISRTHPALWLSVCALLNVAALAVLAQRNDFSLVEPLFVLVVLGGAF